MSASWSLSRLLGDIGLAVQNLWNQKTRTLLTALGIIFGVGAVVGMLAIGAGAREESLRFIEQLGVRNLLIDSHPAGSDQELQQRRRSSPGLTERDVRILRANVDAIELLSPRKALHPTQLFPHPAGAMPDLYGVDPSYTRIHDWKMQEGVPLNEENAADSAAVCVLGEAAKVTIFGYTPAIGKYLKVNDTWLQVTGVLQSIVASGSGVAPRIRIS